MSIRAAISGLLAGDSMRSDPSAALEEAGYEGISADEFGTALTHFAETATLAEADALAPVVTRTGPIPLREEDLPEVSSTEEPDDTFSLFSRTVTEVHQDYGESDLDDLDDLENESGLEPPVGDIENTNTSDEVDLRFGEPSLEDQPQQTFFDESSLDNGALDDAFDDAPMEQLQPISTIDESNLDDAFESEEAAESTDATTIDSESEESDDAFDNDLDVDI